MNEHLDWLREAYARDALTLECFEWLIDGVLRNDAEVLRLFDGQVDPWPSDPRVTGTFAYDSAA